MKKIIVIFLFIASFKSDRRRLIGSVAAFAPPAATAHWDASVTSSLTLSGSSVSQWNDLSGNNNNLTSASGGYPTYNSSTKTITLDGSSQYLTNATLIYSEPVTFYFVMDVITWGNLATILQLNTTSGRGGTNEWIVCNNSSPEVDLYTPGNGYYPKFTTFSLNTTTVVTAIFNSASSLLGQNSSSVTGNPGAGGVSLQYLSIGGYYYSGGYLRYCNMSIKEGYVYAGVAHSPALQAQIVSYLRTKWSI
jgi:hypothetical protein